MATMNKKITPMIQAKTKFHDRALSCGNHTFPPYDCPVILPRGGVQEEQLSQDFAFGNQLAFLGGLLFV